MKVMIMTDLEGPSGINGRSDGIGNKPLNQPIACQMLMDEVNARARGLVKGGADEIVVWDRHGGSNSMDVTKLQHPARLGTIGGDMAPCVYLNASFNATNALGFHAMEGVADGYMNHSYDSWERIDPFTVETRDNDFIDVFSRYLGWAAGVHNRRFGMSPTWKRL